MSSTVADLAPGIVSQLVVGLGAQLADWELCTFESSAPYAVDAVKPTYIGPNEPANAPDSRILLTGGRGIPVLSTRRTYDYPVTIAWRLAPWPAGNVNHANDFLDTLRRRLVGLGPITLGGIPVNGVRFAYDGVLARDSRQRHEAVARYLFRAREASANT